MTEMPARIALALGSGGARGYAHIGVINELRERGHQVVSVAGSSMGALVGGGLVPHPARRPATSTPGHCARSACSRS